MVNLQFLCFIVGVVMVPVFCGQPIEVQTNKLAQSAVKSHKMFVCASVSVTFYFAVCVSPTLEFYYSERQRHFERSSLQDSC